MAFGTVNNFTEVYNTNAYIEQENPDFNNCQRSDLDNCENYFFFASGNRQEGNNKEASTSVTGEKLPDTDDQFHVYHSQEKCDADDTDDTAAAAADDDDDDDDENAAKEEYHSGIDISSTDDEEGEDVEHSITYDHLHQIFVTKNPVLCSEVRKNFTELATASTCGTHWLQYQENMLPNRLQVYIFIFWFM